MRNFIGTVLLVSLALGSGLADAAANGKRVIALDHVRNVEIEMPDGNLHNFGDDFEIVLGRRLTETGRFILSDVPHGIGSEVSALSSGYSEQYVWPGSVVPSATIKVTVDALSFQTGSRGERMFYGFNERFRTPYNNGYDNRPNEFPLRKVSFEANWFDRTFDARGSGVLDSHAGLDLGDGFNIDALYVWLAVKYAYYHSELRLRLDIDGPLIGRKEYRMVSVQGDGYYFDIAGAYQGYSAGIALARRDAMDQALQAAINGSFDAVDRSLVDLPLTARVDNILDNGQFLLGTGPNSGVVPGTRYEVLGTPGVLVEVDFSNSSGSVGHIVQGDLTSVKAGALLREASPELADRGMASISEALESPTVPAAVESISLPWKDLPKSNLDGLAPVVSAWTQFLLSIEGALALPFRAWRYYQYDQVYKTGVMNSEAYWTSQARQSDWGHQIGLDRAPLSQEGSSVVAVIDSGVDYNHPWFHSRLWSNSLPITTEGTGPSSRKDYYGWDFISGDAHPFDDGYHGTEVASLIAAVAPSAKIMPLKIFNPWGITSSAAIYGAFHYAVDHGATIIVCGWATRLRSHAIEEGVSYARDHGVLVVAAAGDRGDELSQVAAYPAALSGRYENVLTVTGVTAKDQLVQAQARFANYDSRLVALAAPGEQIRVATPRGENTLDTSTALSAAMVAGAMVRLLDADPKVTGTLSPAEWIQRLRADADAVPGLKANVAGGLRLHIRH
ncbi:S8 family serine peptidase [Bdellovibrionota bacterium FG-1]